MMKDDSIYLDHIRASLERISDYIKDLSKDEFLSSSITQDAVMRQLEIIGEATKRVSKDTRDLHADIPWTDMAGMRDKLIHHYFDVDLGIVWETAIADVPNLKDLLNRFH